MPTPVQDATARPAGQRAACPAFFLPDFCSVPMVFAVVVAAELLAFVLTLAPNVGGPDRWGDLSLISLFVQWVALSSAAVLCLARPWLCRLGAVAGGLAAYALLMAVTLIVSAVALWLAARYELGLGLDAGWESGFVLRNLAVSAIISAVALRYFYIAYQWRQRIEGEARARVEALQARIRPHFLFNSLNTIAALIREQPTVAETAVEDLSDLFRASLAEARSEASLGDEIELARRYLDIEQLRLGERLAVRWSVDALPRDLRLPALTLQPLVENAVYHGIEPRADGGVIDIEGHIEGEQALLVVRNPLPVAGQGGRGAGNRMALDNIRQRLTLAFAGRAALRVEEGAETYCVTLRLPLQVPA